MERTQIYLDKSQKENLKRISENRHESMAVVIREAVEEYIIKNAKSDISILEDCIGIWKDRKDIKDSTGYVNELRKNWSTGTGEQDK